MNVGAKLFTASAGIHGCGRSQEDHRVMIAHPGQYFAFRFTVDRACWWLTPDRPNRWCPASHVDHDNATWSNLTPDSS